MTQTAAFFDLDNTLIRGSSLYHLARGLRKYKFFTDKDVRSFIWKQLKFVAVGKEHASDMAAIRTMALRIAAGRRLVELEDLADDVINHSVLPKIFQQTVDIAKTHLDRGEQVWIVTASPHHLANILAARLGFTGALGTVAELQDGVFTGELASPIMHGVEKAHAVRSLAAERGIDLTHSTAYSDSFNDVPMLEAVGTAVVVNGDRKLRALARKRGWSQVDFRRLRHARKYGIHAGLAALVAGFLRLLRRR